MSQPDIEHHLRSIELALLRERLGGVNAEGSSMLLTACSVLERLGWPKQEILAALIARDQAARER